MENVDEQEESLITDDDLDDINRYPYEDSNWYNFFLCCFFAEPKTKENNDFIPLHPLDFIKGDSNNHIV